MDAVNKTNEAVSDAGGVELSDKDVRDNRYLECYRQISKMIDSLAQQRSFFTPGEFLTNRMGGGEKKVIHVDGLQHKDRLSWQEITPYLKKDQEELTCISTALKQRNAGQFDPQEVRELIVERMKEILSHVLCALKDRQQQMAEFDKSETSVHSRNLAEARLREPVTIDEGRYTLDRIRMNAAMMTGKVDALLLLPDGSAERINPYSVALVAGGVFQKGQGHFAQRYADSPLRFWNDHLAFRYGGPILAEVSST